MLIVKTTLTNFALKYIFFLWLQFFLIFNKTKRPAPSGRVVVERIGIFLSQQCFYLVVNIGGGETEFFIQHFVGCRITKAFKAKHGAVGAH